MTYGMAKKHKKMIKWHENIVYKLENVIYKHIYEPIKENAN